MGCEWVFVPFSLETVQFVEEIVIVNMEFVRVNPNYRTCRYPLDKTFLFTLTPLTIFLVHRLDFPQVLVILDSFIIRFILAS